MDDYLRGFEDALLYLEYMSKQNNPIDIGIIKELKTKIEKKRVSEIEKTFTL